MFISVMSNHNLAGIFFSGGAGVNSLLFTTACSHCPFSCVSATHIEQWDVMDLS